MKKYNQDKNILSSTRFARSSGSLACPRRAAAGAPLVNGGPIRRACEVSKRIFLSFNLILFLIFSFLVFSAIGGSALGGNFALAAESLPVPVISVNPDIYYPLDEILYLEGRGLPNSTVQIQFQKQGAKPLKFNSKSDVNGEWVLAEKVPLESGDWEVRTRLIAEGGALVVGKKFPNGPIPGFLKSL